MRNRITINELQDMPIGAIAGLPADVLALLIEEAANALADAKRVNDRLDAALDLKYGDRAVAARVDAGKQTGIVRFQDGDCEIVVNTPKRVKWDQRQLAEAVEVIRTRWQGNPDEYVRTEFKVSEAAYGSWPTAIRALFEPARTVEFGKPGYRIEPREVA